MNTHVVIQQFDEGAEFFDAWSVTRDERMLSGLAAFCDLTPEDDLLDVACGTGAFTLHAAPLVRSATGVDISAGMIGVARRKAERHGLGNAAFRRADVEEPGLPDGAYSVVVSRSAFHHMPRYRQVFASMVRCCRPGGRVCLQDVMAYDDPATDAFSERVERLIDPSHHRTRGKREFFDLFREHGLKLDVLFESETLLDFHDYVGHVAQTDANRAAVARLLEEGLADPAVAGVFTERDGRLLWRRRVCTIKGTRTARTAPGQEEGQPDARV